MRIHLIAIGGSVMHNLAICLKLLDNQVTGSDDMFFDPSKTNLQKHGLLPEKEGWNADKVHSGLDYVILGMHAKKDNPELLKARVLVAWDAVLDGPRTHYPLPPSPPAGSRGPHPCGHSQRA